METLNNSGERSPRGSLTPTYAGYDYGLIAEAQQQGRNQCYSGFDPKGITINKLSILSRRRSRNFDKPFSQTG